MRPSGQTGFTRFKSEIRNRTHDSFVDLIHDLFGEVIPGFAQARRLGHLDRQKVDLFQLSDDEESLALAVQCKGFEKPFGDDQLAQCLDEVIAYRDKGAPARHYILATNKRSPEPYRDQIDAAIGALERSGKVQRAEFLDLNRLVQRLKDLALAQLAAWSADALDRMHAQVQEQLAVAGYIPGVPFSAGGTGSDPVALLLKELATFRASVPAGAFGRDLTPPRVIVTSSFGFGKTSTLQALGVRWVAEGGKSIYLPAALLGEGAFKDSAGLAEAILEIIQPDGLELSDEGYFLVRETLRTEMATVPGWVLLLDGIDESPNWRHHNKLGALWMSSADLALPLIASVRDEVYASRTREFQDGGGKALKADFFQRLALESWPDDLILKFLDEFASRRTGPAGAPFLHLRELVARSEYATLYSDIPRRPLFLGMLAEDAWAGREPATELHKLYGAYVRRKLTRDRYNAPSGRIVRDSNAQAHLGEAEYVERVILAMQDLAGRLALSDRDQSGRDGYLISERMLAECMFARLEVRSAHEDLLLNSLLQPAGHDPVTREREVRFAHHSFLDWFTARWSVAAPDEANGVRLSDAAEAFAKQMRQSLGNGEPLP